MATTETTAMEKHLGNDTEVDFTGGFLNDAPLQETDRLITVIIIRINIYDTS